MVLNRHYSYTRPLCIIIKVSTNQQKISKLISYWLRHKPQDGNIQLDKFGWAKIDDILIALKSNNFDFTLSQLIELNKSFDKIRWEIDLKNLKIKATHGHSVTIEQELNPEIPNEILYHGTASKNLSGIIKKGLISGQRQYVHLSESKEMALEVGKRHGKPFLIEINTKELIENGWEFFKTQQNVWLTSNIPAKYLEFNPWTFNVDKKLNKTIKSELKKEINNSHQLYGKLKKLELLGLHNPDDDCLFKNNDNDEVYVIHPTWSGKKDNGIWPSTLKYENLESWIETRLVQDHEDWYM